MFAKMSSIDVYLDNVGKHVKLFIYKKTLISNFELFSPLFHIEYMGLAIHNT